MKFAVALALLACALAHECHDASQVSWNNHYRHKHDTSQARIQAPAPDFSAPAVVNGNIQEVKLSNFKGKYVVLLFYPLDFTFVCPTEIIAFNDRLKEFHAINAEVIGLSVDSVYTHLAWVKTPRDEGGLGDIQLPLVSDLTHKISRDYGVLLEDFGHTLRGLFIIDTKGILRQITLNDLPVGRSVDETLRLIQAFQFTDTNGEVCPAGWTPGAMTINPDPQGKLDYFRKKN
eukprot:m.236844 g.236844  ORF g.236844 m.236844 type:complete len:232 (-) comp13043_c0_seq1:31-726(-)